ncbi:MAG: hypothetical protein M3Y87_23940, partial [Myxococcota bacterium]|nr:hypothetical protein [Myxococcota bacterium]
ETVAAADDDDEEPATVRMTQTSRRLDPTPIAGPPRLVRFAPDPANVRIGIDGAPARTFTTSFREIELPPGRHRFVIEPLDRCCRTASFDELIPPGEGQYVLRHRLESEPAILILRSNIPADVRVGTATGRANGPIRVVIASAERREMLTYTVTAPGHREYRGQVQLAAGATTEELVTLQAEEPAPE